MLISDNFNTFASKKQTMGKIHLESMEFYAFHGHYQEEQIVGNRFLVDLILETDMSLPAETDDLDDAVNYQEVYRLVKKEMKKKSKLLENIARRILDAIYSELTGITSVTITIRKMNPPMGGQMKAVSVTLTR
ncbi:MAG TPA: dihydroneopterin aldolase [Bacteroidales bacterium]|nr:dihydroneopterin aldolase [Bacteroidales bacterium]